MAQTDRGWFLGVPFAELTRLGPAPRIFWLLTGFFSACLIGGLCADLAGDYQRGSFWSDPLGLEAALFTLLALAVCLSGAIISAMRKSLVWMRVYLVGLVLYLSTWAAGEAYLSWTYERIVDDVVARAQAAVDAIHAFEHKYLRPPTELTELVPEFLPTSPESLLEWSAALSYTLDLKTKAWTIEPGFLDSLGLEYAPVPSSRALEESQRRMGNWIVSR